MIGANLPTLSSIVDRARSCPPTTLLEVFLGLVGVILPYIEHDRDCTAAFKNHVIASLSKLPSIAPAVAKPKAPPTPRLKKKPPPKRTAEQRVTTLSKRYALFWAPTAGDAPSIASGNKMENVSDFLVEASKVFQVEIPGLKEWAGRGQSVFDPALLDDNDRAIIESATDTQLLDSWFERQRREVLASPKILAKSDGTRHSVLGVDMAQRIGILVHSLRKSISTKATLEDVKGAILSCTLGRDELTLLLDIIPDEDDVGSQRRQEQWKEMQRSIDDLVEREPGVTLTEDEDFLQFLMRLPTPTRRFQCMFIIPSFKHIAADMEKKLIWMVDALHILLRSKRVVLCWHLLLRIGNLLNEGTARADQKWFTTSALRRALDVRGNKGMTLPEYMAAFTGPVLMQSEWQALSRAKDGGSLNTYAAAKDVIDTFVSALRPADDPRTMMPTPLTDEKLLNGQQDMVVIRMKEFTETSFPAAQHLLRTFLKFIQMYAAAAYFFGDPGSLLPLEKGLEGDNDSEDTPAKDIFARIAAFIGTLRNKVNSDRVISEFCAAPMPCSPRPLSSPRTSGSVRQSPHQSPRQVLRPSQGVSQRQSQGQGQRPSLKQGQRQSPGQTQDQSQGQGQRQTLRTVPEGVVGSPGQQKSLGRHTLTPRSMKDEGKSTLARNRLAPTLKLDSKRSPADTGDFGGSSMGELKLPTRGALTPSHPPRGLPESSSQLRSQVSRSATLDEQPRSPSSLLKTLTMPVSSTRGPRLQQPETTKKLDPLPATSIGRPPIVRPVGNLENEAPASISKPSVNRFRFGFRPGGHQRMKSERPLTVTTTSGSDTISLGDDTLMSPDGIAIQAPRMPSQQRRRKPRSSIEATFALAREMNR